MLRPGSRISSASGVTLVQPSYAQSTLTIAVMMPVKVEPSIVDGQTGEKFAVVPAPRANGKTIKTAIPPTLRAVPTTWRPPPRRAPRTLTVVTTAMASTAVPACQTLVAIPAGGGTTWEK